MTPCFNVYKVLLSYYNVLMVDEIDNQITEETTVKAKVKKAKPMNRIITLRVSDELWAKIKKFNLDVAAVCREALENQFKK